MSYPPKNLCRTVNPDGAKAAGPLLYAWARRTSRCMVSSARQIQALADYLPTAPASTFVALGGDETLQWARATVAGEAEPEVGDNEIKVLGLPYGGPNGGKDNEGQFFSPMTDFMDGLIDSPPVMYTHGSQLGFEPDPVGRVTGRWYDRQGGWFKVRLDPQSPRYTQMVEAHSTGNLRASTGVVPATYSASDSGHIDTWLVGELSLVDLRDGYQPVNGYAITKATFKAEELFEDYYGDAVLADAAATAESEAVDLLREAENLMDAVTPETQSRLLTLVQRAFQLLSPVKAGEFGGKKRSDLKPSDFLFPETESFPVVDCEDVGSAVHSWGRYGGSESFDTFKRKLTDRARAIGCADSLPDEWKTEKAEMEPNTEKCEACDEAARLAEGLKAEIEAASQPAKCARCPEAITKVRDLFKAGKLAPIKAFEAIERFTQSDEGLDDWIAEVEIDQPLTRTAGIKAAGLSIAGGRNGDPDQTVDPSYMNRMRRLSGLTEKE